MNDLFDRYQALVKKVEDRKSEYATAKAREETFRERLVELEAESRLLGVDLNNIDDAIAELEKEIELDLANVESALSNGVKADTAIHVKTSPIQSLSKPISSLDELLNSGMTERK